MNTKGSTHLTTENRRQIEHMLNEHCTRKEIALAVAKSGKTVSRELELRRTRVANNRYGLYGKHDDTPCERLQRFPFVCNTCDKRQSCCKEFKFFYHAEAADENYRTILRETRIGLDITPEDFETMNTLLKAGTSNGQSVHHIVQTYGDQLRYSERHLYRLIHSSKTVVRPIDLRRMVKMKPRKRYIYRTDNKIIRKGRTYADYMAFLARNPTVMPVQMDTVEGSAESEKCLLTVHFTALHFMLIYLLEKKSTANVSAVFRSLREALGVELYKRLFPVILTDRGSEFCDPASIELDPDTGEQLSHVFFCNSYSSYQKGAIEENHTLIRYVIPKGTSMEPYSQEQMTLLADHINGYYRKSIAQTPYFVASSHFGEEVLTKLNCHFVPPENVILKPHLLR